MPGNPWPCRARRFMEESSPVPSPKRFIAFTLWALTAGVLWRKAARWLNPQPEQVARSTPLSDRRERPERRLVDRRSIDRRQGANDMAAWIGAATERRSGRDRRRRR